MNNKKTAAFPNTLFCIYQAVSDDMIFRAIKGRGYGKRRVDARYLP